MKPSGCEDEKHGETRHRSGSSRKPTRATRAKRPGSSGTLPWRGYRKVNAIDSVRTAWVRIPPWVRRAFALARSRERSAAEGPEGAEGTEGIGGAQSGGTLSR